MFHIILSSLIIQLGQVFTYIITCTIADSFIFDNVFMLEGFEDLDFPLKVSEVLGRAVL